MKFRNWLESNTDKTTSLWRSLKVKPPINEKEVNNFANLLTNPEFSAVRLIFSEIGRYPKWLPVSIYDSPIAGTLLNLGSNLLKEAKGTINLPQQGSRFFFCMSNNVDSKSNCNDEVFGAMPVGSLGIRFPPANFNNNDKTLLKSIIRHELTHAYDWNDRMFREENPIPEGKEATFDNGSYVNSLYEARALVSQLNYLLKQIGNNRVPEIIQLLKLNSLSSGIIPYMSYIENYLNSFNEYKAFEEFTDKNSDESKLKIDKIVDIIHKCVNLLQFSNFAKLS